MNCTPVADALTLGPDMVNESTIGGRLKTARERAGYDTQSALADAIGVRAQTIWRVETGGYTPGRSTLRKLARVLNVSEAWLEYGERKSEPKVPDAVLSYLASELGRDCPDDVVSRLKTIEYATLGIPRPTLKDVHRVRELVEFNLALGRKRTT